MQLIWSQESCAAGSYVVLVYREGCTFLDVKLAVQITQTQEEKHRQWAAHFACVSHVGRGGNCISEVTQHFSMRRMCFSLYSTLLDFICLGWIFSMLSACPRLSGFWESFSKMVQLLLSTRLGKKKHILTLLQTIWMKKDVWGILWWFHTLEKEYGICATRHPATPVWFSPNQTHKLSRNLSLCRLRGECLNLKTLPVCFVHEPGSWWKEGRCLVWIKGCREAIDKLWGRPVFPSSGLPKSFWLTKDELLPTSHSPEERQCPFTCSASTFVEHCTADLLLKVVNHCHKKAKGPGLSLWRGTGSLSLISTKSKPYQRMGFLQGISPERG